MRPLPQSYRLRGSPAKAFLTRLDPKLIQRSAANEPAQTSFLFGDELEEFEPGRPSCSPPNYCAAIVHTSVALGYLQQVRPDVRLRASQWLAIRLKSAAALFDTDPAAVMLTTAAVPFHRPEFRGGLTTKYPLAWITPGLEM